MQISVICIGNLLLMDEGVGPACAAYMRSRYRFPDNVEILDRACMGMAIINDLREADYVLVLDAVEVPDARPGQIFSFKPEDVAPTQAGMMSLHDVRFADVLASAEFLGIHSEGHCFGIQVENMSPSEFITALTPRVAAALPLLAQAAVRFLRQELHVTVEDLLESGSAQLELPAVYGEPDVSVMTGYLASSLKAVGVKVLDASESEGVVEAVLPEAVSGGFAGIEFERAGEGGAARVLLTPATTDVDCDRFIGACAASAGSEG